MNVFKLNPLHFVRPPGYSFDCWLMSSGTILNTLQDFKMLDEFIEAWGGGICGIKGDRYVKSKRFNKSIVIVLTIVIKVIIRLYGTQTQTTGMAGQWSIS